MPTDPHADPAYKLIREIRSAFQDLKALSDHMIADLGITAAMRAILEHLCGTPPQTVPQIAEAKNVSRQHVQQLADALAERGLAEFTDNPRHKRSKLVGVTAKGQALFDDIAAREARELTRIASRMSEPALTSATETIAALRRELARDVSPPAAASGPDRPALRRGTRT